MGGEYAGPVMAGHELVQEGRDRRGDDLVGDGGADMAGTAVDVNMYAVYLGVARMLATVTGAHPPGQVGAPVASGRAAIATLDRFSSTRHSNIFVTHGPACGSMTRRVRLRPWPALTGTGCGIRSAR